MSLFQIVFSGSCDQPSNSAHQYKVFIKATEDTKKNKKSDGWGTLTQESSKRECNYHIKITRCFTDCFTEYT